MLRQLREQQFAANQTPIPLRYGLRAWAFVARHPVLYRLATFVGVRVMAMIGRRRGRILSMPFASGWTNVRDLAAPMGQTFQEMWSKQGGRRT